MNQQRLELKVGLFVFFGLALIATLMIYFSKGQSFFTSVYTVYMKTANVGGLKPQAKVLMSGVEVGSVEEIKLSDDGREATVSLKLLSRYKIHGDALFTIDALGFLGDQYVGIKPTKNEAQPLAEGSVIKAAEPFDMQELARAALGFVNRIDVTAQRLNDAIVRIDEMVLNEQTLTNLSLAASNFLKFSERATQVVDNLDDLFKTNASPLNSAVSNFVVFSEQLNQVASDLNETIITNQASVNRAVHNLEKSTFTIREMLADVNAGNGLAGSLIRDEHLRLEMSSMITNLNSTASNLKVLSSNINNRGLWSVLWKPKDKKAEEK
jgi:phospholipid/cholesterol/gamma-HCH transport system substrate-binding protein